MLSELSRFLKFLKLNAWVVSFVHSRRSFVRLCAHSCIAVPHVAVPVQGGQYHSDSGWTGKRCKAAVSRASMHRPSVERCCSESQAAVRWGWHPQRQVKESAAEGSTRETTQTHRRIQTHMHAHTCMSHTCFLQGSPQPSRGPRRQACRNQAGALAGAMAGHPCFVPLTTYDTRQQLYINGGSA